jgi:fucose permease
VLVVPLVPLAMLLTAVAGLSGAFMPQIAGWFALPARLLLTYMLDIVHMLSNIPAVLIHRSVSVFYMIALYAVVLVITVILYRRLPKRASRALEESQPTA